MNRWKIGDVTITRVIEMETTSKATFVLKDGSPENIHSVPWLRPHFANEDGKVIVSAHDGPLAQWRRLLAPLTLPNYDASNAELMAV